jgi:hypothetical protein
MVSLLGSKSTGPVSTHGRLLLAELGSREEGARMEFVLECIEKDPLAGRLKQPSGDNSYHLLVGGRFSDSFKLAVLRALLACPKGGEGARAVNSQGCTPLHLALAQYTLAQEVILLLLQVCRYILYTIKPSLSMLYYVLNPPLLSFGTLPCRPARRQRLWPTPQA